MKLSREGLGLLSKGINPDVLRKHPLLGWVVDLAVVIGSFQIVYWLMKWAGVVA